MPKQPLNQRKATQPSTTNQVDFTTVSQFYGYRHKEDKTNLPSGYLVVGSQNILTNTGGRIGIRKGFTLDGQTNTTIAGIQSAFDWNRHTGDERHLRAGGLTAAGNDGKLQFRYVATAGDILGTITFTQGQIYWIDLLTGLGPNNVPPTSVNFNFTDYWDSSAVQSRLLMVNGSAQIYEWTGGITTKLSATVNTLTKSGGPNSPTWAELGFSPTGRITIRDNTGALISADYTGGTGSQTLTGVTVDFSSNVTYPVQSVVVQTVSTTPNPISLPLTHNDLIANLRNQIYVGSLTNNTVYISKVNNYKNYTFTSPVRLVGEGALVTLDGSPTGLVPQEDRMYMTAGKDQWYETQFILSSDLTSESFQVIRLKTSVLQAARTQAAIAKIKNDVLFLNFETSFDSLGRVLNIQATPQSENISDPIKDDFDSYNWNDASVIYHRYYVYIAVTRENKVLIWNIAKGWWEAPQILPISRFSIINGELYGHSSQVPETYKLFNGYNDNGNPIDARALFSFENYGTRSQTKYFNEFYTEGYISSDTTLNLGIQYDIDGCATNTQYSIKGTNTQLVCIPASGNSLGKVPFGKNPLGGSLNLVSSSALPPKFRWIQTFPRKDFYEVQISYSSSGINYRWEILAFGPLVTRTMYGNNAIKT